ncbi:hypothetical protein Echvi_3773 [Echinicola vietnamensis DSM 17526]|uniref:Uncharacterized protein n=1 Tax=Echinicola vietnamensis (strain DSM 17526 / LMG 23754 / KMM 6221) TaxID=926556 RepID=L0G584_ECHVK|nr:hypothetical protein Echvi_3773 [Echinicola vietnamensis DSM 17526]
MTLKRLILKYLGQPLYFLPFGQVCMIQDKH